MKIEFNEIKNCTTELEFDIAHGHDPHAVIMDRDGYYTLIGVFSCQSFAEVFLNMFVEKYCLFEFDRYHNKGRYRIVKVNQT